MGNSVIAKLAKEIALQALEIRPECLPTGLIGAHAAFDEREKSDRTLAAGRKPDEVSCVEEVHERPRLRTESGPRRFGPTADVGHRHDKPQGQRRCIVKPRRLLHRDVTDPDSVLRYPSRTQELCDPFGVPRRKRVGRVESENKVDKVEIYLLERFFCVACIDRNMDRVFSMMKMASSFREWPYAIERFPIGEHVYPHGLSRSDLYHWNDVHDHIEEPFELFCNLPGFVGIDTADELKVRGLHSDPAARSHGPCTAGAHRDPCRRYADQGEPRKPVMTTPPQCAVINPGGAIFRHSVSPACRSTRCRSRSIEELRSHSAPRTSLRSA